MRRLGGAALLPSARHVSCGGTVARCVQFTCPLCRHPLHRPVAEPGEGNGNAAPSSVLGALLWDVVGNDEAHDTGGLGIDPEEERRLRQEFPIIFVATESIDALLTFAFEAMRTAWGAVLAVVIAAVVSILNLLGVHVQIEIGLGEHRDMVSDSDDDLGGSGMREAAAEMLHVGRRSPERRRRRRNVEAPGSVEGSNRGSIGA